MSIFNHKGEWGQPHNLLPDWDWKLFWTIVAIICGAGLYILIFGLKI
ncbi:MAG: hypothetical protein WC619_01830 [Patescibacteria group bacterium]